MASGSSSSRKSLPAPDGVSLLLSHLVPDGGGGEKTRVAEDKTQSARTSSLLAPLSQGGYIDIVTITHAERMDTVFPAWLRLAYRGGGELYTPWDLNMPASIPRRPVAHYRGDPPITVHGATTAGLLGCGLRKSDITPTMLRCVETAAGLLTRMDASFLSIRIEPSLADWAVAHDHGNYWLTPRQLSYLGFPIDLSYHPLLPVAKFPTEENPQQYLERLGAFYLHARQTAPDQSIVVVGNPGAIIYSRGQGPRAAEKLWKLCEAVEPLSVQAIRVGNNKVLEGQLRLLPLTPTVFKAREVERLAKKAKD
ncbi:unnamed protein product, partial [Mesorhabditis spiculigera]